MKPTKHSVFRAVTQNATFIQTQRTCTQIRYYHVEQTARPRHENQSIREEVELKAARQRFSRKLINGAYHYKPSPVPVQSREFDEVRSFIRNECRTTSEIYRIFQSRMVKKNNYDHTVYVCGMKKCEVLSKHYRASESIFKLLYDNDVARSVIAYNELFRILSKYGKMEVALKYFNYMLKMDKLAPTIITATILIGGCKETADYALASKIWNAVITKFNLLPDCMCYTQLITVYGKACKPKLALRAFKQMVHSHDIVPSITCYGALINCFCNANDVKNASKLLKHIHQNPTLRDGITHAHYAPFMSYYLRQNKPLKALQIYEQCIKLMMNKKAPTSNDNLQMKNGRNTEFDASYLLRDESLQCLRAAVYVQLIRNQFAANGGNAEDADIAEWRHVLFTLIPHERETVFALKASTHRLAHAQLQTMLVLYGESEIGRVVQYFEQQLLESKRFGMWKYQKNERLSLDDWALDLHLMTFQVAQFVLRYVFKYEEQNVLQAVKQPTQQLFILCGKSVHRKPRHEKGKDLERDIKRCVVDELLSWSPPIKSTVCAHNDAYLTVHAKDILNFYKHKGHNSLLE